MSVILFARMHASRKPSFNLRSTSDVVYTLAENGKIFKFARLIETLSF